MKSLSVFIVSMLCQEGRAKDRQTATATSGATATAFAGPLAVSGCVKLVSGGALDRIALHRSRRAQNR